MTNGFEQEEVEIRPQVTLVIWRHSVKPDEFPQHLDRDSVDDQILARVGQIELKHPGEVVFVSDDSVALAKGKALNVEVVSMLEELRLPPEPSPESKLLARLQAEVEALKSAAPNLKLFLMTSSGPTSEASLTLHAPQSPSSQDIEGC